MTDEQFEKLSEKILSGEEKKEINETVEKWKQKAEKKERRGKIRRKIVYEKLVDRMRAEDISISELAKKIGITYVSLNNKITGHTPFLGREINKILDLFHCEYRELF